MDTKPGYKTTEVRLGLPARLPGFLPASGVIDAVPDLPAGCVGESWTAKLIGGLVAVLATLGYSASRAKVKGEGQAAGPRLQAARSQALPEARAATTA